MFMLKYKVQALNEELVAKKEQIERNQDAVRVLEAEWAYFNDPERLRRLSAEHLGFIQSSAVHIKTMSALPFREGLLPPQKDQKKRHSAVDAIFDARSSEGAARHLHSLPPSPRHNTSASARYFLPAFSAT